MFSLYSYRGTMRTVENNLSIIYTFSTETQFSKFDADENQSLLCALKTEKDK